MANEFQHKDPGSELTQAEYITTDGTGHIFDSQAQGDILYATSTTVLARLGKDANDSRVLTNTGANNNPAWEQVTLTTGVTGTLPVANGGTGATTLTDKAVLISQDSGTDTVGSVAMDASGELLIGGTSGPAVGTLTEGIGIGITNGDGSISLAVDIHGLTTDTIASGDFVAFADESEASDVPNKLTVDNLMETGLPLVTEDTVAVASDYMVFLDGGATGNANKESIADFVSGIAGTGLSASSGQLSASSAIAREGGETSEGTTTGTSSGDLIAASSLTIAIAEAFLFTVGLRKTTGASDNVGAGLKLNSTVTQTATTAADSFVLWSSGTGNAAHAGHAFHIHGSRATNYLVQGAGGWASYSAAGGVQRVESSAGNQAAADPNAVVTDVVIQGIVPSGITMGGDELHVYSLAAS